MGWIYILFAMLLLLFVKGYFSGTEIALVSADKIQIHHKARHGVKGARLLLKMYRKPDLMLTTTLVGTNIATVVLAALGTMLMIEFCGELGDLYAFIVFTPVFLVLGEIVPKSVYQQKNNELAPIIVFPLRGAYFLFYPVIFVFSRLTQLAVRLVGGDRPSHSVFMTREQLHMILEMTERESDVAAFKHGRIRRAIRFADTSVGEAMRPLAEVTVFNVNRSTKELIRVIRKVGHHCLPVYRGNASNIVGVIALAPWDLVNGELEAKPVQELINPAYYVTPVQTIGELLPILRQREDHLAIVVDEFGSAVGVLTLEDILEEVVGVVDVGYHFEERPQRRKRAVEILDEAIYLMDARLSISETNDILGTNLASMESLTIGGLVLARLRHIPKEGEFIVESGYRFTVVECTPRAIVKLRVEPEL